MNLLRVVGVVCGVTQLGGIVYVVCDRSSVIKTFSDQALSPLGNIHVERMISPSDIVVCRNERQLYVADAYAACCSPDSSCSYIWRVSVDKCTYVKWLTTDPTTFFVCTLSMTSRGHLLVTSVYRPQLREYSTCDKQLLRVVDLPDVQSLYHGVETTRGTFVISHRGMSQDERHAVSEPFSSKCNNI